MLLNDCRGVDVLIKPASAVEAGVEGTGASAASLRISSPDSSDDRSSDSSIDHGWAGQVVLFACHSWGRKNGYMLPMKTIFFGNLRS